MEDIVATSESMVKQMGLTTEEVSKYQQAYMDYAKTTEQANTDVIKIAPPDDPVFCFMDKKRAEGKPYFVYMTAGANKFIRIYYGRVKEYLDTLDAIK